MRLVYQVKPAGVQMSFVTVFAAYHSGNLGEFSAKDFVVSNVIFSKPWLLDVEM